MTPEEKFLSKIVKNANGSECWYLLCEAGLQFKNIFYFKRRKIRAKKFSYEYFSGQVPPNLKVLCLCGDSLCINPQHHFTGTGSDQIKLSMDRGWKHRTGWKQSAEVIQKISETHKGKVISQELRERLRQANLGKKHSLEIKQKMLQNRIGIGVAEPARNKIAESKQGAKNWNTRLTPEDVFKIRKLAGNDNAKPKGKRTRLGDYTIAEIAEMFGVSQSHVINIRKRKVWKHVE